METKDKQEITVTVKLYPPTHIGGQVFGRVPILSIRESDGIFCFKDRDGVHYETSLPYAIVTQAKIRRIKS